MGPNDKFDLVIKGGDVLDPSQSLRGKRDIGIRWGVIEAIENEIPAARASKTIDASGKLVTPGLIDLHCHVYPYGSAIGIPADELVQFQGTTTVVSAGDAGVNNLAALRRYIVAQTRARMYAFLHIANNGLSAFPVAELYNIDNAQVEACAMALAENQDFLIGVKVRMSENVIYKHGIEPLKRGIQACEMCGWPARMMVHIGGVETGELMSDILNLLRPGDVLTHAYSGAPNNAGAFTNIVQDGKLLPAALAAKQRGVIFDVRPWRRQFRFHRGRCRDPRRLHAGYDFVRHSRVLGQFAWRALSAECDEQVHGDGLHAGAGGDDDDDRARKDHQPRAEDRHPSVRCARRRRDPGSGRGSRHLRRHPQQQARRQGVVEAGADRDQRRAVRPAVSVAVRGEVKARRSIRLRMFNQHQSGEIACGRARI
jgi:predicted amidohydrolase